MSFSDCVVRALILRTLISSLCYSSAHTAEAGRQICARLQRCMKLSDSTGAHPDASPEEIQQERVNCVGKATDYLRKHLGGDLTWSELLQRVTELEEEVC